jgi:hypothetical protein
MAQREVGSRETSLEAGTPGALKEVADSDDTSATGHPIAARAAANIILRLNITASSWTPLSAMLLAGFLRPLLAEDDCHLRPRNSDLLLQSFSLKLRNPCWLPEQGSLK